MDPYIASLVNSRAIQDGNVSQDISQRLMLAKRMSDEALKSLRELSQHSLALVMPHHPSSDVRRQGETIRQNFKTIMANQRIIMATLTDLETAFKEATYLSENKENTRSNPQKAGNKHKSQNVSTVHTLHHFKH